MKIIVLEWNKVIATIKIENGINPINKNALAINYRFYFYCQLQTGSH